MIPEAWDQDLLETRQHLADHVDSWWPSLWGDYRKAQNRLRELCREEVPEGVAEQLALVEAVLEAQRHLEVIRWFESLGKDLFGHRWQGERSDWRTLSRLVEWIVELHEEIAAGGLSERIVGFLAESSGTEGLKLKIADAEAALADYGSAVEDVADELQLLEDARSALRERPLVEQESTFDTCNRRLDELQSLVTYNQLSELCRREGLEGVLRHAESWSEAGSRLTDAFRYAWFGGLVERAFRERPALARFDRDNHEHVAERFRELDRLALEHNQVRLAHAHWSGVPKAYEVGGQLGVLRRETEKKRRHLPIRQLMGRAGNAVQALKPVFMMSPLSIANFLEPGGIGFDLVVFDEASQVRPVEALGAIARGSQVVVVGDSRQLPPTSFFDRVVNAEEIDEDNLTADLESVLGLFVAQGVPERMLRWHYRSRHESLIAVSNNEFYENRLVVFPSPDRDREDAGLAYHQLPDTVYDRGGTRSNPGEAKKVAEAVMRHARECPRLTLGVAAFSAAQTHAIEDQLLVLRHADPSCDSFFDSHPYEPFFVKNIENVQGDERDAIFISVGYGRTATGQVPMSFGPLNQDGGERRLNVLITRARRVCRVFTNMTHDDIDLGRTSARGVRALKTFLRYAGGGGMDMTVPTGREPDSPFEEAVLRALEGAGHRVETQVGSAGFFVDLAVVDPEKPGRYLLGIECDGATYHSARSARDRDRLRQEVLEGLGWRIHRVWSTDWFRNPKKELKRAVEAVEEAKLLAGTAVPAVEKAANKVSEIVRQSGNGGEKAKESRVPRYRMARLGRDVRTCVEVCNRELHSALQVWGSEWIAEVVKVESPVHVREVTRRVTEAAGVSRTGSRIQAAMLEAVDEAQRNGQVRCSGDFVWLPDMRVPSVRDRGRLPDASKKLEFVAPEELAVAIERVVAGSYGIERGRVGAAALRLLGFGRTTRAAEEKVERAIEMLLLEGRVAEKGEQLLVEQQA